ncbi:MAG: ROK family protein [Spirochaetaceae bacterium]|jgi:predicted NBD/HSP70 family sugar kinase|nr:ROK family protein [Spirochaetaceae bacterium]
MMNKTTSHLELIKKINRSRILESIKDRGKASRVQIARELSLSKTTVCTIIDELLEKRILKTTGIANAGKNGGRPASLVSFNDESAYCVGIDIGGTKLLLLITDLAGNIVYEIKTPTTNKASEIAALVVKSIEEAKCSRDMIIGLGIGVPGIVRPNGVVIQASSLNWYNFDLKGSLQDALGFPVSLGNDVNLAAIGERWKGAGEKSSDIFFITIGTGVGSAIIADGRIVNGAGNRSGEVGHFIEKADFLTGNVYRFGEQGVLERKISGTALGKHGCNSEELFKRYSQGDESVQKVINEFILDLAVMIANSVTLLNPQKVIIGGGVSDALHPILPKLCEIVDALSPTKTEIKIATLGAKAGAFGAIAFLIDQVEQN